MFFKPRNNTGLQIKIASYAKIPYVAKVLNVFMNRYNSYNNVFGTIHYVKRADYATYFYPKSNNIEYYNKSDNDSIIPIYNFERGIYQIFKSKADKYSINGENSLLIKTETGKYYVVDKDKDLVVLNESDGKILYEATVSDKLYCNYFYPIANVVVPVLQVTKNGISVFLCNLINGEVHTTSWGLEHMNKLITIIIAAQKAYYRIESEVAFKQYIKKLVNRILNADKKDNSIKKIAERMVNVNKEYDSIIEEAKREAEGRNFEQIRNFVIKDVYYMYDTNEYGLSYLKGIKIAVSVVGFSILFLYIKIELKDGHIICCLDTKNGRWEKSGTYHIGFNGFLEDYDFFAEKYKFDGKIMNNYLSNLMFDSYCYYVRRDSCGLAYMKKGEYYADSCEASAIYLYKNYWIIMNNWGKQRWEKLSTILPTKQDWLRLRRKLAIIDTKRDLMSIWIIPDKTNKEQCCIYSHIFFHYYITRSGKLIFISPDLDCISVIDGAKIEQVFNTKKQSECEKEEYGDITEIVQCFNTSDLIKQAVTREYKDEQPVSDIKAITHHMDKKTGKLYIIARYKLDRVNHTGLLLLETSDYNAKLMLIYDKNEKEHHTKFRKFKKSDKVYTTTIEKMDWYRIQSKYSDDTKTIMMNLDLKYEHGLISSIRYNRKSLTFEALQMWYFYYVDAICFSTEFNYAPDNLIVVNYRCEDKRNKNLIGYHKFCILLTELSIVRKMQVVMA